MDREKCVNKKGVVLAVVIGLGCALLFVGTAKPSMTVEKPVFVEIGPVIVNLSSKRDYLKATMQIELAKPELSVEANNHMPQIKDAIVVILSSKSTNELLTIEGKVRVKQQVFTRMNTLLPFKLAKDVFFAEFVIQRDDCFMTIEEASERIQNGGSSSAPEESEPVDLSQNENPYEPSRGRPYE